MSPGYLSAFGLAWKPFTTARHSLFSLCLAVLLDSITVAQTDLMNDERHNLIVNSKSGFYSVFKMIWRNKSNKYNEHSLI